MTRDERRRRTAKRHNAIKAVVLSPWYWPRKLRERTTVDPDRVYQRVRETPHPCSCYCCGHKRRHEGPTCQERRAADMERAEVGEAVTP